MFRNGLGKLLVFNFSGHKNVLAHCNITCNRRFVDCFILRLRRQNSQCLFTRHASCYRIDSNNPLVLKNEDMKGEAKKQLRAVRVREKRQQHSTSSNERTPYVSLQIIGSGSRDSPPSVLVIAGTSRMMFNCGEGVQRLLLENGVKTLSKFEHFMFTRLTWNNVGGAIGMAIGLKSVGLPKVYFHGPPNLEDFVQAFQTFTKSEALDIVTRPYTEGTIDTEAVVITPVPLLDNTGPNTNVSEDDSYSSSCSESERDTEPSSAGKRKAGFGRGKTHGSKRRKAQAPNLSLAYVCKLHSKPGKILMDKVKALGVKPRGRHLSDLKMGIPHTTEDGKVVKPEDVLGPPEPAIYFIVLECPSENYINAVTTSEELARHQHGHGSDTAKIVIHMCPQHVIENTAYREWIERFGESTEHVILNQSNSCVTHLAVRRLQTKLNLLHNGIFPMLPFARVHDGKGKSTVDQKDNIKRLHHAESYQMFQLRPDNGWNRENVQSADIEPFLQEVKELAPDFSSSLEELKKSLETLSGSNGSKYPEVVFTGTGSAIPNKDRNVTGILVNVSETQSLLMDCGDGTYGQLCRFYGNQDIDNIIAKLCCVFVSHIHADHHSGLIQILQEWNRIMEERGDKSRDLIVIGPWLMKAWLYKYDGECESIMDNVKFIDLRSLSARATNPSFLEASLLERLGLRKFETVPVLHCLHSHGVVLTHNSGWKLAYSGDCMPSETLVKAGEGADLLIHEATLEDGMNEEAKDKKHSMISDALDIGARMKAKFTLLTHFSQRYMKIPFFKSEVRGQVGIAFDNMRVSLSELPILPKLLPVLHHLFADKISEMQKQRTKKAEKAFFEEHGFLPDNFAKEKPTGQDSDAVSVQDQTTR